jgi:hypothetical protein
MESYIRSRRTEKLSPSPGRSLSVTTEFGLGITLFYGVAAYLCWRRRGELQDPDLDRLSLTAASPSESPAGS